MGSYSPFSGLMFVRRSKCMIQMYYEIWDIRRNRFLSEFDIADSAPVHLLFYGTAIKAAVKKVSADLIEFLKRR
jgi:hypothetical protein